MAIKDINRNLGPSVSQSHTTEAIGHAEDMSEVITNISPEETKFLSMLPSENSETLFFEWMSEHLNPPKVNAHLEDEEYTAEKGGSLQGLQNHNQYFVNTLKVTEAQRKVSKVYREKDELARLMTNRMKEHAHDIEYAIVSNSVSNAESGIKPAMTGGIPYFMKEETLDVTVSTTDGVITASEAHDMKTGDFVYFNATTMPTGLKTKTIYYIRLDDTAPATKFTLYNTLKGAVEKIADEQVKPSAAGTAVKIIKNNVISLGGAADYTLDDLNTVMEMVYNRGGNPTKAYMSPAKKRKFSQLVTASTTINRDMTKGRKLELVADVIQTDYGTLTAESHRMLPDSSIFIMDTDYMLLKWFQKTRTFDLPKTGTSDAKRIESWLGLKITAPRASGAILGIKR